MSSYHEMIAVIQRDTLEPLLSYKTGFIPDPGRQILENIRAHVMEAQRGPAEHNKSIVQFISSFFITYCGQVLRHCKHTGAGETRLHGLYTPFFGGHMKYEEIVRWAPIRELDEEIEFNGFTPSMPEYLGIIYDPLGSEVSQYHFGLIHQIEVYSDTVTPKALDEIADFGFDYIDNMKSEIDKYDNWAQLFINSGGILV